MSLYDKLVRDKIPEIIQRECGHSCCFEKLDILDERVLGYVKQKLKEEVKELLDSENVNDIIDEIADVIEILKLLAKINSINWEEVSKRTAEKRYENGGFNRLLILKEVLDGE